MPEQQMQIKNFERGAIIFRQGEREKILYKILSGRVGIYSDYKGAKEIRLALLEKDQCFGEMSILEDCPRSATAIAEEEVLLAVYPEHMMDSFINQNPTFALSIMKTLSKQLRNSTNELEKMHQMLLNLSAKGTAEKEVQDYISRHTLYAPDGTARFNLKT